MYTVQHVGVSSLTIKNLTRSTCFKRIAPACIKVKIVLGKVSSVDSAINTFTNLTTDCGNMLLVFLQLLLGMGT